MLKIILWIKHRMLNNTFRIKLIGQKDILKVKLKTHKILSRKKLNKQKVN
jgi:hypothetical protein